MQGGVQYMYSTQPHTYIYYCTYSNTVFVHNEYKVCHIGMIYNL